MAADEKKPKIDLKARLGKGAAGAAAAVPAAAVPVPAVPRAPGSVAPPPGLGGSVPPPGVGGGFAGGAAPGVPVGVPMPPFGGSKPQTDPFGVPVATSPVARPAPSTIKIELDEETVRAAQRGGKRATILGSIMLVVGLGLGFAWGGRSSDAKGATVALQGAQELIGDIDKSQGKIKELKDKIGAAVKDMKEKKFPESFASELGGLSIPFGADKLAGRNIGRFDGRTLQMLFNYTNSVEAINDRKDALKNLFSGQKATIVAALGAASNPKVSWSVFVQKSPAHGPIAVLAAINPAESFAYKESKWPEKFKISTGRELVETERYQTGDVFSSEKKVATIPLDPDSVASSFPNDILTRITSELAKTEGVLAGSGTPGDDDETGVIAKGEQLLTALKKIGQK
ncbi:MAG TPA: hypothetical protein VJT73_05225 [Polyangiaceae bacterium]|nr:hypothetical protein [Polyangiaceae bacterium]